jgi:hypothetical protein
MGLAPWPEKEIGRFVGIEGTGPSQSLTPNRKAEDDLEDVTFKLNRKDYSHA